MKVSNKTLLVGGALVAAWYFLIKKKVAVPVMGKPAAQVSIFEPTERVIADNDLRPV